MGDMMTYEEAIRQLGYSKKLIDYLAKELSYTSDHEPIDMAIEALKNAERYKWHDLRNDENDLPSQDGLYYTFLNWIDCITPDPESETEAEGYTITEFREGSWSYLGVGTRVLAWKEIEKLDGEK